MPRVWLSACAASALLLCAVVLWLARNRPAPAVAAPAVVANAGSSCAGPVPSLLRAQPEADGPPLLLWAVGEVRLFLDGEAVFSPPEEPRHFPTGEHLLRIEAAGQQPVETRIRLDAFTPALVHAQVDGEAGITVVTLGAVCMSCESPVTPLALGREPSNEPAARLMARAAAALRRDDWRKSAESLRAVAARARATPLFRRLEAATWRAGADPVQAREAAARLKGPEAHELDRLLARLGELEGGEERRYASVVLARWNRITEQHASLLRAATGKVKVNAVPFNQRMESLSAAFNDAREKADVIEQERVFVAAEKTTSELMAELLSERPNDCAFQASLALALAGTTP